MQIISGAKIKEILQKYKTIAVIGCSRFKGKDAHIVPAYLQAHGYNIIPINPFAEKILGERAYLTILELPKKIAEKVEIVNIFRPRFEAEFFVRQAIEFKKKYKNLKVVWMQLDIFLANAERKAAQEARKAGLIVIENKCMMQEHGGLLHGKNEEKVLEEGMIIVERLGKHNNKNKKNICTT